MGGGTYSTASYKSLSSTRGYDKAATLDQVFVNREVSKEMKPLGVSIRESRDSVEHPLSVPVMVWLDVTGSMGRIPFHFIKESMPYLMEGIIGEGVKHPQIFFGAIGDHKCDNYPLQVGQFESSTELITKWLTETYMEGNGGGNGGESYLLSWYFAAKHTVTDHFEKRGEKGFLFTIGDEPCHNEVPGSFIKSQMGPGVETQERYTASELLAEAQEKYHVFHIHVSHGGYRVSDGWQELLGDNLITVEDQSEVASIIAKTVTKVCKDCGIIEESTPAVPVESDDSIL